MRLSTVFELLLIFLLIAFAAYGRVIDDDALNLRRDVRSSQGRARQEHLGVSIMSLKQATENVNKYCNCNENVCNCCREFNIPLVALKGPGCASLQYRDNDSLAVQLNFGNNILTSKVISGKKPQSICVPMLGGFSKFCGRIYSIERESSEHFKACLGLELQSSSELEASLRVSCFRFGPDGVKLRPAEQFPIIETNVKGDEDDDDDDDDIFGLDDDDDDEEEDDEQLPSKNTAALSSTNNQQTGEDDEDDDDDDDDEDDILGFGALFDIITGGGNSNKKKTTTAIPILPFTIPLIKKPTTAATTVQNHHEDSQSPHNIEKNPTMTDSNDITTAHSEYSTNLSTPKEKIDHPQSSATDKLTGTTESIVTTVASMVDDSTAADSTTEKSQLQTAASNNVKYIAKPEKSSAIKRITVGVPYKKFGETSNSANAIKNDLKKPLVRPAKPDPVHNLPQHDNSATEDEDDDDEDILSDLDDDDDDDYENEENSVEEEDEDDNQTNKDEKVGINNKKPDNLNLHEHDEDDDADENDDAAILDDDDDDDDDEEEDAVLSALVSDEKDNVDKVDKVADNKPDKKPEKNNDYNVDLSDLLSKKRHMRRGRQSKVMRL
ncbi:hypothetical protein PV325_000228 [Microctonus aethiopoides]|uniref:DUF4773 domain-containing protein n=1 Tax=Microctonus aethiopoides TaxID=144406 RepID=A0AA39FQF4_9HYME|nr:hypothetical protein PV325_000228 [Microctonus aethiopoides]KAK0173706.1 hypothetical protein PV328_006863 [Microctonus aethiopoides]